MKLCTIEYKLILFKIRQLLVLRILNSAEENLLSGFDSVYRYPETTGHPVLFIYNDHPSGRWLSVLFKNQHPEIKGVRQMAEKKKRADERSDESLSFLNENAGSLIKMLRTRARLSGEELGEIIGLSQQQVSRYERGISELTLSQLQKFAAVFDMSIWEFMDRLYFIFYMENESNTGDKRAFGRYDPELWWGKS